MIKFRSGHTHAQHRAQEAAAGDGRSPGTGRRRLLTRIGTIGLLASAGVFGSEGKALANCSRGCCSLWVCPTETISICRAHATYTWYCSNSSGTFSCECCESPGNSAYWCFS
jgi:hypothetical protein